MDERSPSISPGFPDNWYLGNQYPFKLLGPVVCRPISVKSQLNFNQGCFLLLFKSLFGIIFSTLFRISNHQIVGKKKWNEFSYKAFRSEIKFHNNLWISLPSFEQSTLGGKWHYGSKEFCPKNTTKSPSQVSNLDHLTLSPPHFQQISIHSKNSN